MHIPSSWIFETHRVTFHLQGAGRNRLYSSLECGTQVQIVSVKLVLGLKISYYCKYLVHRSHQHMHTPSTGIMQVRMVYRHCINESHKHR